MLGNCQNAIIRETPAINPCKTVDGISVIYFVNFSSRIIHAHIPVKIASIGRV